MADRDSKGRFIKNHKSFLTEETRKKMSETAKRIGTGKWMLGRKLSDETKAKVRANASKYWLGKKRPDMIGNNHAKGHLPVNSFKKGQVPWNKGKKMDSDFCLKMGDAQKKTYLSGRVHHYLGKKRPEFKGGNNPLYGKFGKEHPKWTDVKKRPFYKSIREIFKYVEWRKSIFDRDNYSCRLCGKNKCYIEADHYPKRFIDIIRNNDIQTIEDAIKCAELWDVGNGRTLCKPCHLKTLTWGNTKGLKKK